jgi:UDP-glucose 4-epimerase
MKQQKVCLVTSAAGAVGQHILASLVAEGHKVLALGEVSDMFSPEVLKKRNIKVTTALPATAKSFEKHDVQFYFGDIGDISFLASIFATAEKNGIEIEYVFHLSANAMIQKSSPAAYHPDFAATANILEVSRAYWQSHKDVFRNFFYVADSKNGSKIETMIEKIMDKESFPATIYKDESANVIGSGYKGKTQLSSLYRVVMPVGIKKLPQKQPEYDLSEKSYIKRLLYAVKKVIN